MSVLSVSFYTGMKHAADILTEYRNNMTKEYEKLEDDAAKLIILDKMISVVNCEQLIRGEAIALLDAEKREAEESTNLPQGESTNV